jgi:hypothetical protein
MMVIVLGVGAQLAPRITPNEAMPTQTLKIIGNWEKIAGSPCSQAYPDAIQFQEGGLYFGQKDPPGAFTQWDVGTFEVVGPKQVKISTANDAIVSYGFSILNDVLTFVDPDGCEYSYRRVS